MAKKVYVILHNKGFVGIEEKEENLSRLDTDEKLVGSIESVTDLINLLKSIGTDNYKIETILYIYHERLEKYGYNDFPEVTDNV